tara:strand:+ start:4900 stop:5250 length:351 start_codon:yes stop_codon:yes gene_type:complete
MSREDLQKRLLNAIDNPVKLENIEGVFQDFRQFTKAEFEELQANGWFEGFNYDESPYTKVQVKLTPEQEAKELDRRKMITQVVGAEWKYEDESLDQYKQRKYGIPIPTSDIARRRE